MKKIGLIGCGNWGSNILRDLIQLNCEVYVVDIDSQARIRSQANGAKQAFSKKDDLPECNGYVVAVPIPELTKETTELLKYKKPIFSEKTLCLSMDDFTLLKDLGGLNYVFCMHKWHYHPGIEALRLIAQSGKIGEIKQLVTTRHGWVNDFHGGDVFWTLAVHDLTIIKHILGYIPDEIKKIEVSYDENGLPVSMIALLGDRPSVFMSVNGRQRKKISGASIQGEKGFVELQNAYDPHINLINNAGEEKISIDTTFPLFLELNEFVNYLNNGPRPRCDLYSAKEITSAILMLREEAGLKINTNK